MEPALETRTWRAIALRGLVALAFGLLTLFWPDITLHALVLLFGAYVFIDGVSLLIDVFSGAPGTRAHRGMLVAQGIAGIVAGILAFVWPGITALVLLYLIAAWAIVRGALEIAAAIVLRHVLVHEWFLAFAGAVSILFGIILVVAPRTGALAITWLIGLAATFIGVVLLAVAWHLRSVRVPVRRASSSSAGASRRATRTA
jgi:uncharacterized membrane protein HdeD (DUF308 family)